MYPDGAEPDQPDRALGQEDRQEGHGDGGVNEKRHVDDVPREPKKPQGRGEQYAYREEHAVQRQQHSSVRSVGYFRDVNDTANRHA